MSGEQGPTSSHEPSSRGATPVIVGQPRHKRSAKNYLLDAHFQLKYTSFLVGIALLLSVMLGYLLYSSGTKITAQSRRAVEQSKHAVEQSKTAVTQGKDLVQQGQATIGEFQNLVLESQNLSKVVQMNIAKEYADSPDLAKVFQEDADKKDQALKAKGAELEKDAATLKVRAADLEKQAAEVETQAAEITKGAEALDREQRALLYGIIALLTLLVVLLGVAGIVFTHKVAGPIFKMKRLLRQVGEGKLIVRERLRKGDELQHFFETFEKMVEDLRGRQKAEIAKVDEILEKLENAPVSQRGMREMGEDGVDLLKRLRAEMQDHLEA